MLRCARYLRGSFWVLAAAITGALAIAPASAPATTAAQVEIESRLVLVGDDFANKIAINWVVSPSGAPDIVIADTLAGIQDPIPPACARVDAQIIRCSSAGVKAISANLGLGNDLFIKVAPTVFGLDIVTRVEVEFGPGADQAVDEGPARDVWDGGPGKDRMDSGPGRDRVKGGSGADVIDCGPGKGDVGIGGPGRDLGKHCETVKH